MPDGAGFQPSTIVVAVIVEVVVAATAVWFGFLRSLYGRNCCLSCTPIRIPGDLSFQHGELNISELTKHPSLSFMLRHPRRLF